MLKRRLVMIALLCGFVLVFAVSAHHTYQILTGAPPPVVEPIKPWFFLSENTAAVMTSTAERAARQQYALGALTFSMIIFLIIHLSFKGHNPAKLYREFKQIWNGQDLT